MNGEDPNETVYVPPEALSKAALAGLIEAYVLREGTDYGREEMSFEAKIQQVRNALDHGRARIVFDPESASTSIIEQDNTTGA